MSEELLKVDLNAPLPEPELEVKKETKPEEEEKEKTLKDYLGTAENSPSESQLEEWKQQHGEVLCSGFSQTELLVFRPITRMEFTTLQTIISQSKEPVSNFEVEQKIVDTCVLWASKDGASSLTQKAGSLSTLHEQILQASNFVDPAYASRFVQKL